MEHIKSVILAGGRGTRLQEVTREIPKPMVEVGERPILWHIMKYYASFGVSDFNLCLGYRSEVIKDFFLNYRTHKHSLSVDLSTGKFECIDPDDDAWKVNLFETGLDNQTGSRIFQLKPYLGNAAFFMTYGDGLCNVNLKELYAFHKSHGKIATVTAVQPPSKFGSLKVDGVGSVESFSEKPSDGGWINGGYFILEPEVFDFLSPDQDCVFEQAPLEAIAKEGQLRAFKHDGFWQCVDTLRELQIVNDIWKKPDAPWKVW